ncbi:VOC family protein [Trujillonella humicola]|uniref:VOC family protein n=1 Tax=Trujillonella humicola TaxID=3383699 RepID=UPI00390698BD
MGTRLVAYLSYRDAPAALRWLQALGFDVVRRADAEDGTVAHSELRRDDVVLMISSDDAEYSRPPLVGRSTGGGLYLVLDDAAAVDGMYLRGIDAGGTPVFGPEDTEWGTRRARLLDPEGGEWSFGSYVPGESGEGW